MQHDVMISYSSRNEDLALKILDGLETAGIRCWISCRDVKLGQDYSALIPPAIKCSRAVVFVLCRYFNDSMHARREVGLASDDDKLMIPMRTEEFELSGGLSYFFAGVQHVNAFPDFDRALSRVITRIKEILPTSGPDSQRSKAIGVNQHSVASDDQPTSPGVVSNRSIQKTQDSPAEVSRFQHLLVPENSQPVYWFFNVGEDKNVGRRAWEDNRKFGFMSAGTDIRFRRFAQRLRPGDLVFAYLSGNGYVGFGEVTMSAVMLRDFALPDGMPLLRCNLTHPQKMTEFSEDYDRSEWAVGISWRKTLPREAAVKFPGIFSNVNTVCRFKHEKSLAFLLAKFG